MIKINSTKGYSKKYTENKKKNQGGILGGIGYIGGSAIAGAAGTAEGIIDLLLAFGGDVTGNHDYAEWVFKDNTVGDWHASITEDYNPGAVMQFAGDVSHGLGQSSWFLLSAIPGAQWLGPAVFGAGMLGQGVSGAAEKTGDVGLKEVAYGATTAAVETGLETALGGTAKLAKNLGKQAFKTVGKNAIRKGLVRNIVSDAAGEFAEEFASEYIDTTLQRGYKIDPNASTSLKDALYAGAVGFVSGAVSAGSGHVGNAVSNQHAGAKIIKNGNSQTLVNTATKVADKLAAQGTKWEKAPEWVKAIRGQVDAYNNLSADQKTGLKGQTILGEMQRSLFFAEHQATFDIVKKNIQGADEQKRATWAEYINQSTASADRKGKVYTAADIANDVDGIAHQLAIFKYVPAMFDIDGAVADIDQEQRIADFVAEKQGAMKRDVLDVETPSAVTEATVATERAPITNDENVTVSGAAEGARLAEQYSIYRTINMNWEDQLKNSRRNDTYVIEKNTPSYLTERGVSDRPLAIPQSVVTKAKSGKDESHSISDKNISKLQNGIENAIAVIDDKTRNSITFITNLKEEGKPIIATFLKDTSFDGDTVHQGTSIHARQNIAAYLSKFDSASITILNQNEFDNLSRNDTHNDASVQESGKLTNSSISQPDGKVNPTGQNNSEKNDLDEKGENSRSEAVEGKAEETGAEVKETASKAAEETAEAAKSVDSEVDLEKAKRDAERMLAWEKKNAPTAKEINTAREYVNGFDSLPKDRQMAIIRMMRSSKGVDVDTVRGVANLMAITNKKGQVLAPDLEFRFAEGINARGIKTEVGSKTLVLLDSQSKYKDTIRGSIAHELVHYLENRKGYDQLAAYAYRIAKNEKIQEIEDLYDKHYKRIYTDAEIKADPNASAEEIAARVEERMSSAEYQELVESEVTASIVGEALNSEKFLKRYANMSENKGILKTALRFIKGIFNSTKDKDKNLSREAQNIANLFDRALASEIEGEQQNGEKYSFAGEKAETADNMSLAHAKQMLADGVDSETIRKETGWFKGYDNKWRFEIDDFESGLIENPKLERHEDDGEIYFTGKLTDIFNHDALFKAYPELKNINIVIQKTEFGVYGIYQPNSNYITLSIEHFKRTTKEYYDYANGGRKAEIERIEATPEFQEYNSFYDKDADDIIDAQEWLRQEQELRDRFFSSELGKRYYQLMWGKSGFTGNKYEFGWGTGGKETLLHELQHAIQNIEGFASGTSTRDLNYSRNAGELEAYDTERRINLTAEERKNTRPDIDREDVVFAEGVSYYQASSIDEDEDVKSIRQQLKNAKDKLAEIAPAKSKYPPRAFKNAKEALDWAVNILKASGQLIQRQEYGDIVLDEKRLKNGLSYLKTDAEKVAFSLIPKVIKNGIEIGRHSKHKGRNYDTVTFALPVTVGNKTGYMAVVIREEGKKYFKLHRVFMPDGSLFEFTETEKSNAETAGLQNANLSPTNVASNNSIHQNEPIVNTYDEKNDLDPEIEAEQDGEVSDEYFEAAIKRAYEEIAKQAEITREKRQQQKETATEKRKKDFDKLLSRAISIQNQIEKLRKNATDTESKAKLKKLKQDFNNVLGDLGALQIELRQMGYDLSAEQRLIERQQEQIENQGKQILTLKEQNRNLKRAEREEQIIKMVETRENARMAELFAKQKAKITSVYSEDEIKRDLRDMLDNGLIPQFFGGDYQLKLSKPKRETISRYIALQLNMTGSAEKAEAQGLIRVAALDIVRSVKFTEGDSKTRLTLDEIADKESREYFIDAISAKLEEMIRNAGELNPYADLQKKYNILKAEFKNNEGEAWGKEFPKVVAEAKRMRNFAINKKGMAADGVQEVLKAFATLTDESGHLYSGRVDEVMQAALSFFEGEAMRTNSERGQVKDENKVADDSMIWDIDPDLKDAIELFVQMRKGREGKLMNSEELKLVREILRGMRVSLERYNKEKIGGKFVDIDMAAGNKVKFMQTDYASKTLAGKLLNSKFGKAFEHAYFYEVLSPAAVFDSLDGYEIKGLLSTLYRDIRMAAQSAEDMKARLKDPFVKFVDDKDNKWKDEKGHSRSYRQKLNEKKISVDGVNITLGEAINLYMLTKREHTHLGLREGGFVTRDKNGNEVAKIRIPEIEITRNNLYSQFDEADRKFVAMAEEFFNKTSSEIKAKADEEIYGYPKTLEGYYVPIMRDRYARNNGVTDVRQSISNFATVNNKSFNKELVRNNKALEGQNIFQLISAHADGLADYANLYMPLKAFDRVYNRGVSIDGGDVTTLREQLNKEWSGAHKYFTKLFKDIQGVRDGDPPSNVDKIAGWIRSNWVSSVLGANLKVVCTQTTSLGAATQIIDARYVTKASWIITPGTGFAEGVKAIADRADKYSKVIFSRSFESGAIRAQGNLDKIGDVAKASGTLIGIMDRKVCLSLFHAAELSVEASTGHKVGTQENAVLAAKLADEAIHTTQAMNSQAEKSNLQRSNSELTKLFSMFTSDSVKNLSHFITNAARYIVHKDRAKSGDARYQAELKKDGKALRRSARTMLITGIMLGVITQGFKYLYDKEEEKPEDKIKDFAIDIVSSTLNVFPIASEIIDKLLLDYDMSVNVLDVVNDTLGTFGDGFELMGKAMGGEHVSGQAIGKTTVNIGKSALSLFGFPISPVERTITGLLRRFSPGMIYGYDSMMHSPTYSADLKKAVENGDEALAEHILSTLYKNEATGVYSTPELEEVARLYGLGHTSVIPQKIGTTVNDVKLDAKQRKRFEQIYGAASGEVDKLIRSEYYKELTGEQRAKAIKNIYSLFYNRASAEVTGAEWSNAQAYSRLTTNYAALFASQAYKSGLAEYKTSAGKVVTVREQFVDYAQNLGLSQNDLLVILYANGYRDKATKEAMMAYINSLTISAEEKSKIAERLGFAIKDGVVVEKTKEYEVRDQ